MASTDTTNAAPPWASQSQAILARQVPDEGTKAPEPRKIDPDWETIRAHLEGRLLGMRTKRWAWWRRSRVVSTFIAPERFHFFITPNRSDRDGIIGHMIVNNTATDAADTCGAGLWMGLCNPASEWFKTAIALPWVELKEDAKEWIEDADKRLRVALNQSNFYSEIAQSLRDVSNFGTSPLICYENDETIFQFYLPCPGEFFVQVGSTFKVDVLAREYTMTVGQIVEEWKLENCPDQIKLAWARAGAEIDKEYTVSHMIEPNFPLKSMRNGAMVDVMPKVFSYREIYWITALGVDGLLSKTGNHEKPFSCGRWSKVSNDAYAPMCPGLKALGDVQQLQLMERRADEYMEKGVRPPMGADISLENKPAATTPGSTTYMDTSAGPTVKKYWPLFEVLPAWLQAIVLRMAGVEKRIQKAFFVDAFRPIINMEGVQPRNELELKRRISEALVPLGPAIDLMLKEHLAPTIQRCMGIMLRRGLLNPMPDSLRGIPLKINFRGILQQAQEAEEGERLTAFGTSIGEASEAAIAAHQPSPARVVNWDKWARRKAEVEGIDLEILRTADEVQQLDAHQQQAMAQAQIPGQAMIGAKAAQTLAQTPTSPGTALHAILGGKAGP